MIKNRKNQLMKQTINRLYNQQIYQSYRIWYKYIEYLQINMLKENMLQANHIKNYKQWRIIVIYIQLFGNGNYIVKI